MSHRKGAFNARHNSFTQKVGANYIQIRMQSMPGGVGSIQYTITYKLSGSSLKLSKNYISCHLFQIIQSPSWWTKYVEMCKIIEYKERP